MNPIADTLLAVMASIAGDTHGAQNHLAAARRHSQAATRRQRQLIEIATLVVAGRTERASGLALVHLAEFPQDQELLDRMTGDGQVIACHPGGVTNALRHLEGLNSP